VAQRQERADYEARLDALLAAQPPLALENPVQVRTHLAISTA
jgi:hypothetical protein